MTNNLNELYSPAKAAEQFKRKPGYHIVGQHNRNRDRDAMTLAALKKYDDENHSLILKESREYRFNTFPECAAAKWHAWAWAMKRLGIKVVEDIERNPKMAREMGAFFEHGLQKELKEKDIVCEERPPKYVDVEQDLWKSGMYVYYHGDIVYFISNPMKVRAKEGTIYLANRVQYIIMTNARADGKEHVFTSAEVTNSVREAASPAKAGEVPAGGAGETKVRDLDAGSKEHHGVLYRLWRKLRAWLKK